jgi:hypothetical protein
VQEGITKIHVFFDEVIANRHRVTLEGRGGGGGEKKEKESVTYLVYVPME